MRYYRNYGAKNINLAPIDDLVKVLPTHEQTGKIVTFDSPFTGLPLKKCIVDIPITQEGTGDPSPDNVRNFVGVDSLDFSATGKNLCPPVIMNKGYVPSTGEEITSQITASSVKFPIDIDKTYVFTKNCNVNSMFLAWDAQDNFVARSTGNNAMSRVITKSFFTTIGEGTGDLDSIAKIAIRFYESGNQDINDVVGAEYQIELGDTATTYELFGDTKLFSFGQTIYAGVLDVLTGILNPKASVKIKDLTWTYQSANTRFYSSSLANIAKLPDGVSKVFEGDCECYKVVAYNNFNANDKSIAMAVSGNLFIKDTNYTDVTSLLEAVGDYEICYALATPEVINLGGMNIETIQGENNLFASTGDTTAEYYTL